MITRWPLVRRALTAAASVAAAAAATFPTLPAALIVAAMDPATVRLAAQAQATDTHGNASVRRFVAIGCIERASSAGGGVAGKPAFTLTDNRPEPPLPPLRYRLEGDDSTLSVHVGHMVEVAGPLVAGTRTSGVAALPALKVESLAYISRSCARPPAPSR
jgi:hypothetical protein